MRIQRLNSQPAKTNHSGPKISDRLQRKLAGHGRQGVIGGWGWPVRPLLQHENLQAGTPAWLITGDSHPQLAVVQSCPTLLPASPHVRGLRFRGRLRLGCWAAPRREPKGWLNKGHESDDPQPPSQALGGCRISQPRPTASSSSGAKAVRDPCGVTAQVLGPVSFQHLTEIKSPVPQLTAAEVLLGSPPSCSTPLPVVMATAVPQAEPLDGRARSRGGHRRPIAPRSRLFT
jgi:hypothetical protein